MPTEIIVERLKSDRLERKGCLRFIIQGAAVLKGLKQANMLFMSMAELKSVAEELRGSGLGIRILYSISDRHLVLIYRPGELDEFLGEREVMNFLRSFGYEGKNLDDYLPRLRKRIASYYGNRKEFPHEIGAFLGYPLCDILGFLEKDGEGFLYSGYWKVYNNLEETVRRFEFFDRAREEAVDEWFAGRSLRQIACLQS